MGHTTDEDHDDLQPDRRGLHGFMGTVGRAQAMGADLPLMQELSEHPSPADLVGELSAGAVKQIVTLNGDVEENLNKLKPLHITKRTAIRLLVTNKRFLIKLCVQSSVYCAAFHEAKQGAKHGTRRIRYLGPSVSYVCDVMMPTVLYGPIFGFLLRLKSPF